MVDALVALSLAAIMVALVARKKDFAWAALALFTVAAIIQTGP